MSKEKRKGSVNEDLDVISNKLCDSDSNPPTPESVSPLPEDSPVESPVDFSAEAPKKAQKVDRKSVV